MITLCNSGQYKDCIHIQITYSKVENRMLCNTQQWNSIVSVLGQSYNHSAAKKKKKSPYTAMTRPQTKHWKSCFWWTSCVIWLCMHRCVAKFVSCVSGILHTDVWITAYVIVVFKHIPLVETSIGRSLGNYFFSYKLIHWWCFIYSMYKTFYW